MNSVPSTTVKRFLLVGDSGGALASGLRDLGHRVDEIDAATFPNGVEMADVVTILPVWFQDCEAPDSLAAILEAAGVPMVTSRCVLEGHRP
jgi:hypothetical protein